MGLKYLLRLAGVLGTGVVLAQGPGALDTNFVTVAGTDAPPTVLAPVPGGGLDAGGSFADYGGTGRAGLVRLMATGAVDPGFTLPKPVRIVPAVILNGQVLVPASTNAGSVSAVLVLPDGRPVIAGAFSHLGETPAAGLTILTPDGPVAVAPAGLGKVEPSALLPGPGGGFYVGGKGSVDDTRLPLLRYQADGVRDPGFTPPTFAALGYLGSSVPTLVRGPGDTLYVATAAALPGFIAGF